jgi:cell division protein FtsN
LLLANLGMLAWIVVQPEPQVVRYRPSPVPAGIEPLVLLSERDASAAIASGQAEPDAAATAEPEVPEAAVTAAQEPAAATSVAASETAREQEAASQVVQGAEDEPVPVCKTIGPLLTEADAHAIRAQLATQGFDSKVRAEEVRNPSGYWVFMPAMPAADARRVVAELDAHGLTDHYIGKQNYISLGIFSRKDKAQEHLDRLKALGFDAILDQRYRKQMVYWLDVVERDRPLLESRVWASVREHYPDIRSQRAGCE